jgi:hypothetical protein
MSILRKRLLFAAFLVVYLCAGIYTQMRLAQTFPPFLDFGFYNRALGNALAGSDPYDVREIGSGFLYPPPALLFMEPFHLIPVDGLRAGVYTLFNLALLTAIIWLVSRRYGLQLRQLWPWIVLTLGFAPLAELLYFGQINLISLFGMTLLFLFAVSAPWLAGLGLAIAIVTKVSPGLLLVYLLATRKFKAILWTFGWVLALSLVALLRYGPGPFVTYPGVFQMLTHTFPVNVHSQALAVKLNSLFGIGPMGLTQFGVTILIVLLVGCAAALVFMRRSKSADLSLFALTVFAAILSTNIIWYHYYVFLLLPLALWVIDSRNNQQVIIWVLAGLLTIQIDRWLLTTGLLSQLFCFLTLLGLFLRVVQSRASKERVMSNE